MASSVVFNRVEWAGAYQNTAEFPEGYWLSAEGTIPLELEGTYYRNGPGLFQLGRNKVAHPFDGHGLVASIAFRNKRAYFRSCYVQTKEYQDEIARQKVLYKGTFGTLVPGGLLPNLLQIAPRNPANTGLAVWGGRCLALFEAGQPHVMDARTLQTSGLDMLGGAIKRGAPFSTSWPFLDRILGHVLGWLGIGKNMPGGLQVGGEAVSAHPVQDPASGHLVIFTFCLQLGLLAYSFLLFGWRFSLWLPGLVTRLSIREFNKDFAQQSVVQRTLSGYAFLHDMSVTPSSYVIFQNPVRLRMLPLLLGTQCPAHCIDWVGDASQLHIIPRPVQHAVRLSAQPAQLQRAAVVHARGDSVEDFGSQQAEHAASKSERSDLVSTGRFWTAAAGTKRPSAAKCCSLHTPGVATSGVHKRLQPRQEGQQHVATRSPSVVSATTSSAAGLVATAEPSFVFHQVNAYEDEEASRLVIDCVRYPRMPDFRQASSRERSFVECVDPLLQPISQLWRYSVEGVTGRVEGSMLSPRAMEFPAINPAFTGRKHRWLYAAAALHPTANAPQQALAKLDTETGQLQIFSCGPAFYTGEPVFVARPGSASEDAGWVLSIWYDASSHTSYCIILDASDLQAAPLARLPLGHALPHGLHGAWDDEYQGPDE